MHQSRELNFAINICQQAGKVALDYWKADIQTQTKADGTPVTIADKQCERLIRQAIALEFPDDNIVGEEEGEFIQRSGGRTWIIDPIDGTYNFARQSPIFSTLLALEKDGDIVLGVVQAPAMNQLLWAERGQGAFLNNKRIQVSAYDKLADSQFNFGGLNRIIDEGLWDGFSRLASATARQRGFGDFLSFAYVFEGKAEIALDVGLKPWDLAPMKVLAEESGGRFTDLSGRPSIYSGSCLVSNGLVHEQALRLITGTH